MLFVSWFAIFPAALSVWWPTFRWLSLGLLIIGYSAALVNGQIGFLAAIPVTSMCFAAYAVSPNHRPYLQYIGHAIFIVLAIALSMHWLPGFHNPRVIGPVRFTADAVPFSMYLNLDKPLAGFWLLLVLPWTRPPKDWRVSLKAGLGGMLMAIATCLLIAVLLGLVRWEPKWPPASWLWLLNNLLLVTLTEEALFRGYLQGGLSRLLRQQPYADTIAICISAVLFGLAHVARGWQWIVLGGVAGIGYGSVEQDSEKVLSVRFFPFSVVAPLWARKSRRPSNLSAPLKAQSSARYRKSWRSLMVQPAPASAHDRAASGTVDFTSDIRSICAESS